ncbi:monocarboxylate transporter 12-like [Panulirus ornatus]|uniref:monocarboxylate transporter 12-like n=1 Tax=Panulirus ornatus TaxID=150431 RepID=UPI003A8553C9
MDYGNIPSKMPKFNLSVQKCEKQPALVGYGYWNEYFDDEGNQESNLTQVDTNRQVTPQQQGGGGPAAPQVDTNRQVTPQQQGGGGPAAPQVDTNRQVTPQQQGGGGPAAPQVDTNRQVTPQQQGGGGPAAPRVSSHDERLNATEWQAYVTYQDGQDVQDSVKEHEKRNGIRLDEQDGGGDVCTIHASVTKENLDGTKDVTQDETDVPESDWRFIVGLGCFVIMGNSIIIGPCFGTIFSGFLLDLDTTAKTVTWIYNMGNFMWCTSLMVMSPFIKTFGWRKSSIVASSLITLGFGISAFASSAWFLMFSICGLTRFGDGMMVMITHSIIPKYFTRRCGMGFAFIHIGVSVNQLLAPLLVTYLQQEYGFRNSVAILAALVSNNYVATAVFHPVEWHIAKPKRNKRNMNSQDSLGNNGKEGCAMLREFISTLTTNLRSLKSPTALIILFSNAFVMNVYLNFFSILPFAMVDAGYTQEEASWCLSVSGVCNLLTRLVISLIIDYHWFDKRVCYMVGMAALSLSTGVFGVLRSLWHMAAVLGLWGIGLGACITSFPMIIIHYMGQENILTVLSTNGLIYGLWFLAFGPVIGLIRDVSGSYAVSLAVLASTIIVGFILWFFMPTAIAYEQRMNARQHPEEAQEQQIHVQQEQQYAQQQLQEAQQQLQKAQQQPQEAQQQLQKAQQQPQEAQQHSQKAQQQPQEAQQQLQKAQQQSQEARQPAHSNTRRCQQKKQEETQQQQQESQQQQQDEEQ